MLPPSAWPELAGDVAAAALIALMYPVSGGAVTPEAVLARRHTRTGRQWAWRLGALCALAVALWLLAGWIDTLWQRPGWPPLLQPNPWAVVTGSGAAGALLALLLYGLRALALVGPLVPVAVMVRGTPVQLTVLFALLWFIVGTFAPRLADAPYPARDWLLAHLAVGAAHALLLAAAFTALLGQRTHRE